MRLSGATANLPSLGQGHSAGEYRLPGARRNGAVVNAPNILDTYGSQLSWPTSKKYRLTL